MLRSLVLPSVMRATFVKNLDIAVLWAELIAPQTERDHAGVGVVSAPRPADIAKRRVENIREERTDAHLV